MQFQIEVEENRIDTESSWFWLVVSQTIANLIAFKYKPDSHLFWQLDSISWCDQDENCTCP